MGNTPARCPWCLSIKGNELTGVSVERLCELEWAGKARNLIFILGTGAKCYHKRGEVVWRALVTAKRRQRPSE